MDLQSLFGVLWRKKWILIVVPFFAASCAFTIRFFGEWKFKSSAQLATGLTISDDLIDKSRLNPFEVQVTFNNLIEITKSRSVLGQVSYRLIHHDLVDSANAFRKLDKKTLDKFPGDPQQYTDKFKSILEVKIKDLSLLDPNHPLEKLLLTLIEAYGYDYEAMIKELTVARLNQSDFIDVSYVSEHPELSAFIANAVCSEFIRYYSAVKASRSSVSLESLESIAKQRKDYLDVKVEELKVFKASNDLVNSSLESEDKIRQLREKEDQIAAEQQRIRGLELTLANLKLRIEDAEMSAGLGPNDQIVALRRRINAVNERYIRGGQTDNSLLDSVTLLRSQLDALMRKINQSPKLSTAEINNLKTRSEESRVELEIARENLNSLTKVYNSLRYSMGDFANKEARGNALEREVEVATQEYLAAQNRFNEAKEKLVTDKTSISQIIIAEPAEKAESRKTLIFMVFSGVLSFIISAFIIVVIELADSRIKTGQRLKRLTRMKVAGIIPKLKKTKLNGDLVLHGGDKQSQKRINEEVRKIRFEVDSHKARVLLVTSIKNGQGKSFFIVALAYSLSLLKKRILIIDTNLRNNTLTKMLIAQGDIKLLLDNFSKTTKLLEAHATGSAEGNQSFDYNLISKTPNNFIDIIGNKKSQMSPSELIPGADFKVLLEWLKVQYDYIIMEGPALNNFSDSKELTAFAELIIPVFSADSTVNGDDTEALNYLKSLQRKLGPAVLNNVEPVQ